MPSHPLAADRLALIAKIRPYLLAVKAREVPLLIFGDATAIIFAKKFPR